MAKRPNYPKHRRSSQLALTMREHMEFVFHELQGVDHKGQPYQLREWAMRHPSEFYRLAASLIPKQLQHDGNIALTVVSGVPKAEDEDVADLA
jgi:hypothetical protein